MWGSGCLASFDRRRQSIVENLASLCNHCITPILEDLSFLCDSMKRMTIHKHATVNLTLWDGGQWDASQIVRRTGRREIKGYDHRRALGYEALVGQTT
jgi:hypothetical protein